MIFSPTTTTAPTTTTTSTTATTTTTKSLSTTTTITVDDIFTMIDFLVPEMSGKLANYGCIGKNNFDVYSNNAGKPIDSIDRALAIRKQCIKCADSVYDRYDFNTLNEKCKDGLDTDLRTFCECDLEFVQKLKLLKIEFDPENIDSQCYLPQSYKSGNGRCCKSHESSFKWYNKEKFECCEGKVVPIGQC